MFNRLTILLCTFAFLAACAGSKGGGRTSSYDDDDYEGGGGGGSGGGRVREAPVRADDLKDAHKEAVNLTEENHKLAKEIFDLKNKLGLPTDE
ncbi:MAG: hypothetical protein LBQ76_07075 [Candidatus Fibromonas sp.]|jgi:hypothetical protein|nr:hypothetical protein [Candidatus Fibromonas sp.]